MTKELTIGCTGRDITSGIEGIITSRTTFLTGNVQFSIQVKSKKDGAYIDPMSFDIHQVDFVDAGVSARAIACPTETGITLGEEVEDLVSGFKGIAMRKCEFMNGCVYYSVQAKKDKDNTSKEDFIEYRRLKVISKGVVAEMVKRNVEIQKANPTAGARPPGGPVTRAMKCR